jgi:hypothetical protein
VVLVAVSTLGCAYEPPPDLDDEAGEESSGTGAILDDRVFDGHGMGVIRPARIVDGEGLALNAVVIGTPSEDWETVARTGQISILVDDGEQGLIPMNSAPATIIEDWHADACPAEQAFAWDRLEHRRLGGALAFYNREGGSDFEVHRNELMAAAPTAGQQSGRVMNYVGCHSCALFPRPEGDTGTDSNLVGGRFGAALAVGFFGPVDAAHPMGVEALVVGAPDLEGSGRAFVLDEAVFRTWNYPSGSSMNAGGLTGDRECQCNQFGLSGNSGCLPFTATLQGVFPAEEFGAALAVADFDCDGRDDLAVGAPGATLPGMGFEVAEAGAVYVYLAKGEGIDPTTAIDIRQGQFEVGGEPEPGDRFGAVLGVGDFDGSRRASDDRTCFDLVVAAPGEDEGAGQIQVFYGSPSGLEFGGPVLGLDEVFGAEADAGDRFGAALVAGDFAEDVFDDLAIGAPGDGLGGSVTLIPGGTEGLEIARGSRTSQSDVDASDELGDDFGASLTWVSVGLGTGYPRVLLIVGSPGEDDARGAVHVLDVAGGAMSALSLVSKSTLVQSDIYGDVVRGDRFGEVLLQPRAMADSPWK